MIKNRIFEQMAKRDIRTRRELAQKVGISESNISRIVGGNIKAIRFDTLEALCRTLDCQITDMFEYIPDKESEQLA